MSRTWKPGDMISDCAGSGSRCGVLPGCSFCLGKNLKARKKLDPQGGPDHNDPVLSFLFFLFFFLLLFFLLFLLLFLLLVLLSTLCPLSSPLFTF